jgi:hypothetical protein
MWVGLLIIHRSAKVPGMIALLSASPILIGWLLSWMIYRTVRWVRRGFSIT